MQLRQMRANLTLPHPPDRYLPRLARNDLDGSTRKPVVRKSTPCIAYTTPLSLQTLFFRFGGNHNLRCYFIDAVRGCTEKLTFRGCGSSVHHQLSRNESALQHHLYRQCVNCDTQPPTFAYTQQNHTRVKKITHVPDLGFEKVHSL
jgi:hypothetical protein